MDHAARDKILVLFAVRLHVRGGGVRLERVLALPFLDHHERIGAVCGRSHVLYVHRRAVFDAARLREYGRAIGGKILEYCGALARLRCDDGDDVDHGFSSGFLQRRRKGTTLAGFAKAVVFGGWRGPPCQFSTMARQFCRNDSGAKIGVPASSIMSATTAPIHVSTRPTTPTISVARRLPRRPPRRSCAIVPPSSGKAGSRVRRPKPRLRMAASSSVRDKMAGASNGAPDCGASAAPLPAASQ